MKLIFSGVSKSYGKTRALAGFSATLTPGVCALFGPNGSGKTTLMNVITDNLKADGGTISFSSGDEPACDVRKLGPSFRGKIGYMPQNPGLYGNFTAEEYLAYMAELKGVADGRKRKDKKREIVEEVARALETVELGSAGRRRVGALSGGMKQRLALAQAILGDPSVVILDEPTAGLDPELRITVRNLLSSLGGDKIVIVSTHIVSDVENVADRVILLKRGTVAKNGPPDELIREIEGTVWEATVPVGEASSAAERFSVSSYRPVGGSFVRIRLTSSGRPFPDAVPVSPTLEDLYLSVFGR